MKMLFGNEAPDVSAHPRRKVKRKLQGQEWVNWSISGNCWCRKYIYIYILSWERREHLVGGSRDLPRLRWGSTEMGKKY